VLAKAKADQRAGRLAARVEGADLRVGGGGGGRGSGQGSGLLARPTPLAVLPCRQAGWLAERAGPAASIRQGPWAQSSQQGRRGAAWAGPEPAQPGPAPG
jgi:hypothetical protein